jgi:predicted nucleotide-binding protein (sugar kinase/HSP70/actin superfamily)
MDAFEESTKKLINNLKNYSIVEFYHEEQNINRTLKNLSNQLDQDLEGYLPKSKIV